MRPLRTKIVAVGTSAAIAIPLTLAKMYEWAPGATVRARLSPGGAPVEREVRELYGGRAAGILLPKDLLDQHRLAIGDEVDVPFYEWETVRGARWPNEEKKKPAKR